MNFPRLPQWLRKKEPPPLPTLEQLREEQAYHARVALLQAQADAERANATVSMLTARVKRLGIEPPADVVSIRQDWRPTVPDSAVESTATTILTHRNRQP